MMGGTRLGAKLQCFVFPRSYSISLYLNFSQNAEFHFSLSFKILRNCSRNYFCPNYRRSNKCSIVKNRGMASSTFSPCFCRIHERNKRKNMQFRGVHTTQVLWTVLFSIYVLCFVPQFSILYYFLNINGFDNGFYDNLRGSVVLLSNVMKTAKK